MFNGKWGKEKFPRFKGFKGRRREMDFLKAEIERKRQATESLSGNSKKTFVSRGEMERLRQEAYRAEQAQREAEKEAKKKKKEEELAAAQAARKIAQVVRQEQQKGSQETHGATDTTTALDLSKVPVQDIFKRLRAKGQPIRLFGETEQERWRRLGRVEASDDRQLGQKNDFKALMEATEEEMELLKHYGLASKDSAGISKTDAKPKKLKDIDNPEYGPERIRSELLSSDPELLHRLISVYFKRLHKEWERKLQERPDEERLTDDGKRTYAICQQSHEYMKPFYRRLKKRTMDKDVLEKITEICEFLVKRQYRRANDIYLRLSIGNAPWPIGVTNISIHERSAHERIDATKVGHVLNDETTRKWIQSIKRLMTFAQSKYPPTDLTELMG